MVKAMLKCMEIFELIGQVSAEILTNSHLIPFALRSTCKASFALKKTAGESKWFF